MQVWVETYAGYGGLEMPRRFRLDDREIDVVDNLDQRHGPDHRYFKAGTTACTYILRVDEVRAEWELIMFQSVQAAPARVFRCGRTGRQRLSS